MDPRIEAAAKAMVGHSVKWQTTDAGELAAVALAAADAVAPRTVAAVEDLDALPVGSVVLAHWSNGSQPDYQMTRCPDGAASAGGGFGLAGGSHWLNMWSWGATLTVLWEPTK